MLNKQIRGLNKDFYKLYQIIKRSIKRKVQGRLANKYWRWLTKDKAKYYSEYSKGYARAKTYYWLYRGWFIKPKHINEKKMFWLSDMKYLYKLNWLNLFN